MRFINIISLITLSFLFCFSASSQNYQAAWSCGKSLKDLFWTINSNGEIIKNEDDDTSEEVYGLVSNNKIELIRMTEKDNFELASSIIEQLQWKKIGNTYIGNGVVTIAEQVLGVTFSISDEQSVGTVLAIGNTDAVAMIGVDVCERLY